MNTKLKLYIGNLAETTTARTLQDLCSLHGNVAEVNVPLERETGRRRGFAIVIMATTHGAQAVTRALHGKQVDARVLTVTEQVPARNTPSEPGGNYQPRW